MDFSKFSKKVQAVASSTAKKAGEQVQIAKLQIDKTTVTKEMTDAFTALGKYCYLNLDKEDFLEGAKEYKRDIDELKLKIADLDKEIALVKENDSDEEITADFEEKPLTFEHQAIEASKDESLSFTSAPDEASEDENK